MASLPKTVKKLPVLKVSTGKVSPRATSPRAKKKKCVKNTFEIIQFKKMIGKDLITLHKGVVSPEQNPDLKAKILSGSIKIIGMSGYVSGGIVYIFDGADRLIAVNSISYADIKKYKLEIDIVVNQYSNLSPLELP
jgi:hypothetical protein